MSRMKTFFKYALVVILFYIFSNVMINAFFKVSYTNITNYDINVTEAFVDVTEAKVSKRNGYINGIIKNNTDKIIENRYLKFSMLSKNGNVLGEKYVRIDKLEINQIRNFEVRFDYDNVKSFKIEMTDTKPEEIDFLELVKNNVNDLVSNNIK